MIKFSLRKKVNGASWVQEFIHLVLWYIFSQPLVLEKQNENEVYFKYMDTHIQKEICKTVLRQSLQIREFACSCTVNAQ